MELCRKIYKKMDVAFPILDLIKNERDVNAQSWYDRTDSVWSIRNMMVSELNQYSKRH